MIPRRFFWLFDFLVLTVAFVAAYVSVPLFGPLLKAGAPLRRYFLLLDLPEHWTGILPALSESLWILLVMCITGILVLGLLGSHGPLRNQTLRRIFLSVMAATLAGQCVITFVMFTFKSPSWSRLLIYTFALLSAVGLITYRIILRKYFLAREAAGYYFKNVLVIGLPASIEWLKHYFDANIPQSEYRLVGHLRVQSYQASPGEVETSLPALGDVDKLGDLLIHHPVHEVIAIHPASDGAWVKQVIKDCDYFAVPLRIVPEALLLGEYKSLRMLYHAEPLHLPAVILAPRYHIDSEALFFKRVFDIVVSGALLILLFPLLVLIAIAIKLTTPDLPVFYPWRVVGQNGIEFTGYKFTTMVRDADNLKPTLMQYNEMTGPVFKMKDDPRITRLGRFLRRYSLNELPQLWSVLKGDMSLVGPRPAGRHELERYEFWHKRKLSIQSGITCLWQVNGRNNINDFDDWVRMDLEYIDNWSLWLDFKILIRTAKAVIAGTGW